MKVACLTVVYPGMESFVGEYAQCIDAQTYRDFDLIVLNDGLSLDALEPLQALRRTINFINVNDTPLGNRLLGLRTCSEEGYDLIVCSDSDETMCEDRIEKVVAYFAEHPDADLVYNNSEASFRGKSFSLYHKDRLVFDDLLDFNVLGYGAMNLRTSLIPFILQHENDRVTVFDWWLALVFLLNHDGVDFLPEAKNRYRFHENNLVGPIFNIEKNSVEFAFTVKESIYAELSDYCSKHGFEKEQALIQTKMQDIKETMMYILEHGWEDYLQRARTIFEDTNIFWWQNAVTIKQMESNLGNTQR